jgi:hypothetical protein
MEFAARFQFEAVLAENHATQFVAHKLGLLGVACRAEALSQLEEGLLPLFLRFQAKLDEFHQNAVVAEASAFGDALDLFRDLRGKRYAAPNWFYSLHGISMHHYGA